ncbi:hypothetical protein JAAARDRAFT_196108 [Jaapia argillacea MUCL 33604]|uniref:F-box domain-containing protein n=1 Tax=Jaapia argillacea MUCL 33604 TaxID=933084 RepID=A0A067PN81_9AGAM|nr:hypothetical protein JAAARDRAFT_196108 [Jaapia argillacea MUCL 33604]
MPPSLPQELIDIIIDNLDDDLEALRACSLTCRDWLPFSRKHLFDTLALENLDFCQLPVFILSNPLLAQNVRNLRLTSLHTHSHFHDVRLICLIPYLKNITRLRLDGTVWNELSQDTKRVICTEFPSVRALALFDCQFSSLEELPALVNAYPLLQELWVEYVELGVWRSDDPEDSGNPREALPTGSVENRESSLTSLTVDTSYFPGFSTIFSQQFEFVNLVQLDCAVWEVDIEPLQLFFQSVSTALRELKIHFHSPSQRTIDTVDRIRLLSHPFQLTDFVASTSTFDHILTPRLVQTLLSQLQNPPLETLIICGFLYSETSMLTNMGNWDHVNHVLSLSHFSKLRSLEFSLRHGPRLVFHSDIEGALSSRFPGFAEKGWLKFTWQQRL